MSARSRKKDSAGKPQPSAESSPSAAPSAPANTREKTAPREFRRYVWQRRWFQSLLAVLVIFLVLSYVLPGILGLLYAVRSVLVPVLVGLALAYIINPVLRFAELRLKIGRLAGTISVMLLALVVLAAVLVSAVPLMYKQGGQLIETIQVDFPLYGEKLLERIDENLPDLDASNGTDSNAAPPSRPAGPAEAPSELTPLLPAADAKVALGERAEAVDSPVSTGSDESIVSAAEGQPDVAVSENETVEDGGSLSERAEAALDELIDPGRNRRLLELIVERLRGLDGSTMASWAVQSLDIGVGLVGSAISFTSYLALSAVIVGFCFFFFSWKFDAILGWFADFIPATSKPQTLDMLKKMDEAVSSFVRGRVIQSVVMMIVLSIGFPVAGVPYWFLLAVATGLMNLVPFLPAVGWIVALILTVMTTLANGGDFTLGLLLWPSVAYIAAQSLDGWIVEPVVQGQATNLDPLSVMLVVLIGGTLLGLLGMLLAIPLAACIKILAREMLLPKLRGLAAEA
ncbi:MAG: AI-2E family transporter [Planctomycetota bacterium]